MNHDFFFAVRSLIIDHYVCVKSLLLCLTLCDSMDYSTPVSFILLPMGFSRQEYWSGLPFPPLGDLPDPGIKPVSLASPVLADRFFGTETPGKSLLFSQRWPICKDICGQGTFISGYVLPTI